MRFPDVAASVLHLLCDFLSDTNTASALDVIYFIREIIQVLTWRGSGAAMGFALLGQQRCVVWRSATWVGTVSCMLPDLSTHPPARPPTPQTNPRLHDTIIERLMDTFPSIRATRVASCALWIISEYCTRSAEVRLAAAVVECLLACCWLGGESVLWFGLAAALQLGLRRDCQVIHCCAVLPTPHHLTTCPPLPPPWCPAGDCDCGGDDQDVLGPAAAV